MTPKTAANSLDRMRAATRADRPPVSPPSSIAVQPPGRKTKTTLRYTIDLAPWERRSLRLFALDNAVDASDVIKAMIRLLERDLSLSERLVDELRNVRSIP